MKKLESMIHIGQMHIKHNMPCQDRAVVSQDDGLTILALSDGMGSYIHSGLGAEFAINYVREYGKGLMRFVGADEKIFVRELKVFMYELAKYIMQCAYERNIDPGDCHCTLSFSLIDSEHFLNVSIGDSPLYTLIKDGPMFLDGNDNGSDRENLNQTYSVLEVVYDFDKIEYQIGETKDLRAVLITSDGAIGWEKQNQLLNKDNFGDLPDWFYYMIKEDAELEEIVEKLVESGYDDVGVAYYVHDESLLV